MLISDVSVRRPVFAAVISLILVIVGAISASSMTIREYPDIQRPVVSVETNYRGAAADIVERRVTQLIENQIAGIAGIRKISSSSADGRSEVSIEFSRDRDIDAAANDVRERVARTLARGDEPLDEQQVPGGVPAHAQLGEHDERRVLRLGAFDRDAHFRGVPVDVPDHRVDLRHRDEHGGS